MAFAIGAAFANTLCSAKSKKPDEDAALERGESSTFAQPSPFGRASIVPPLDFSSLGADENQFDVEASPYHDPGAVDRSGERAVSEQYARTCDQQCAWALLPHPTYPCHHAMLSGQK